MFSNANLDKRSPIPLYFQLKELIKGWIEAGTLKTGERLPSEREFAEHFSLSRMTVRQATDQLVDEGLLVRRRGRGTFVAAPKFVEGLLLTPKGFTEDMKQRGLKPMTKLLYFGLIPAAKAVADGLGLPEGERVIRVERLRFADGEPMAVEDSHLPAARFSELTKAELAEGSLYRVLTERHRVRLRRASETLEAREASIREAALLKIEANAPVLVLRSLTVDQTGRPVELGKSVYRADRYRFHIEL